LWLVALLALAILLGEAMRWNDERAGWYVVLLFVSAALAPLIPLAFALRRLGRPVTWGRLSAGLAFGAFLSVPLAIFLNGALPALVLGVALPLREVAAEALDYEELEEFFYSPALVVALVHVAVVAPFAEELVKPLGAFLLARRLSSRSEAFIVGMAGGVAFAAIENLLYGGSGYWAWTGVISVRAIGSVLHPLTAGLLGVAWYDVRRGEPGSGARLVGMFTLAYTLHMLWNGGIAILYGAFGAYWFDAREWELTVFDVGLPGAVLILLVLLGVLMWRILWVATARLSSDVPVGLAPRRVESPRQLAAFALATVLVLVPVGALAGPLIADYAPRLLGAA
jgi:RsiW-degrading membrane proteinase PrsW (M82 family)